MFWLAGPSEAGAAGVGGRVGQRATPDDCGLPNSFSKIVGFSGWLGEPTSPRPWRVAPCRAPKRRRFRRLCLGGPRRRRRHRCGDLAIRRRRGFGASADSAGGSECDLSLRLRRFDRVAGATPCGAAAAKRSSNESAGRRDRRRRGNHRRRVRGQVGERVGDLIVGGTTRTATMATTA